MECREQLKGILNASGFIRLATRGIRPAGEPDREFYEDGRFFSTVRGCDLLQ